MSTSKVLKPRRGSTAEHATFKGQAYEITFDTDKKTIVAHDGLTMGGFPLALEADVEETDTTLRALIDQKISEIEGVSSSELQALDSALRGLINTNAQQQAVKDENQDNVISALNTTLRALIAQEVANAMSAASAAQSSADAANTAAANAQTAAETAQATADECLPLDGSKPMAEGASIKFARRPTQDIWVAEDGGLMIGSGSDGAYIKLRCLDDPSNPGAWMIVANNGTNSAYFTAYPDARLTFGGKHIVRTVNGTAADAAGNVTIALGGAVTQKLNTSFSGSGEPATTTKTVSGLTALKPVYIGIKSNQTSYPTSIRVTSGTAVNSATNHPGGAANGQPVTWLTVVPTGTSISIYLQSSDLRGTIVVYQ